jgi:hypothetical protein
MNTSTHTCFQCFGTSAEHSFLHAVSEYVLLIVTHTVNAERPGHKNDTEHACVTIGSIILRPAYP